MKLSFMQRLERGEQSLDIDDFIDEWHDGPYDSQLHEFLGMTHEEYVSWVTGKRTPKQILEDRKNNGCESRQ